MHGLFTVTCSKMWWWRLEIELNSFIFMTLTTYPVSPFNLFSFSWSIKADFYGSSSNLSHRWRAHKALHGQPVVQVGPGWAFRPRGGRSFGTSLQVHLFILCWRNHSVFSTYIYPLLNKLSGITWIKNHGKNQAIQLKHSYLKTR